MQPVIIILAGLVLVIVVIAPYIRKAYIGKITNPAITSASAVNELYYSDYFSFQSADERGMVLLAIDNNRWKNTKGYGLDHFLSMYAHGQWIKMTGNRKLENLSKELMKIPDDTVLTFTGSPDTGLIVTSKVNQFELLIAPLRTATKSLNGFARFDMLSASAVLTWQGKKISGRVIEEYLVLPHFSRQALQWVKLSAGSTFTGLYLSIENKGDLYLHHKTGSAMSFIGGMDSGFIRFEDLDRPLDGFNWKISGKERKWLYTIPKSYSISLSDPDLQMELTLNTISRNDVVNFIMAGFSMAAVEGNLRIDGKSHKVWGFGELLE